MALYRTREVWCSEQYLLSYGVGPIHKQCDYYIWHPGLKLSDGLDCWFTKAQEDHTIFCDELRTSWRTKYSLLPIHSLKTNAASYILHITTWFAIWFELSDQRVTLPNVTRRVVQNTLFFVCVRGSGHETTCSPAVMCPTIRWSLTGLW